VLIGDLVINKEAAELLEAANDEVREDIDEAEEKKEEEVKTTDENIKHTEN
jgi:tRNA pseudouridine13 synthase